MAHKPSEISHRRATPEPGVYLFVHVTKDAVQLLKAARVEHAPRQQLRSPLLTRETAVQFDRDASELVLAAIGETGIVDESFGWSAVPEAFVDGGGEHETGNLTLGLWEWDARWQVPLADSTRYLQFYRSDFVRTRDGRSSFSQISLGVFDLKPGGPELPLPPFPVPPIVPPFPVPLPPRLLAAALRWELSWFDLKAKSLAASGGGYIKGTQTLVSHGDPWEKFNIVILGDGFQDGELSVFDHYASLVHQTLTATPPFANLANRINVYKVSVVSAQSGITNCPACGTARNTYFRTTGCWNGSTYAGFIGTSWSWRIFEAVDTVIPQQYAHLVVTIVNCRIYGGSAPPELGLTFVTLPDASHTDAMFMNLAAHESGHVIGKLCEEYNPCNHKDPLRTYPNETTQTEVDAGTVWWQALALPGEVQAGGMFAVIHRQGDPVTAACQPASLSSAQYRSLGAFWGCHNGEPAATAAAPASGLCDPRGRTFYRATTECRMRNPLSGFCRVCSWLISDRILSVST